MIQLVRMGEGRDRMALSKFVSHNESDNDHELSLQRPILVRDTPESIGMTIPRGGNGATTHKKCDKTPSAGGGSPKTKKHKMAAPNVINGNVPFSVRDVADAVGHSTPVQVINVLNQEIEEDLGDWTFRDLVEYFEDPQRLARDQLRHRPPENASETVLPASPSPNSNGHAFAAVSPTTGRSRRKAAIKSEKSFGSILDAEGSSGMASDRILNQISYEFSGTLLNDLVRSPQIVRDVDWIDHAWPAEQKPRTHNSTGSGHPQKNSTKSTKKVSKGNHSLEYPVVQYYCLTSAAGSYTDFHIDFGGSSVWYHVVRGQKIFCVAPPTRHNLKVYEEWLCHPNQANLFLPDLLNETKEPYMSPTTKPNAPRFVLDAGETLLIPAGWIHAVYTPVDSLVFGGNYLHGLDIQMQLAVNGIEARSRVLNQYRFPHFGALQMYAAGMYLQRLRKSGPTSKSKIVNRDENPINYHSRNEKNTMDYHSRVLPRELEELPMLINALEYWWQSEEQKSGENGRANITREGERMDNADYRTFRVMDSITSHASFRDAASYVTRENGCASVEDFLAALRKEHARVFHELLGSSKLTPSDIPSVPRSTIRKMIGMTTAATRTTMNVSPSSTAHDGEEQPKKKKRRNRSGSDTHLEDPLNVVLSKKVKEYLASIQITTAAQLLLANTTEIAKPLPEWRRQQGMPELNGKTGAVSSVSVWKKRVRLRAAAVGATKLAQLNEGANLKPLRPTNGGNEQSK